MKRIYLVLLIIGMTGIAGAVIITPEFLVHYLTHHPLSDERSATLHNLRWFSFLIGCLLMLIGIVISKFPEYTKDLISRPAGTMLVLIAGWIMAAFINFMMKTAGLNTGTPDIFPFSEFYGPRVHFFGLPYTILFLAVFLISLKYSERFNVLEVWITGLMLVVLGNLAQGGVEEAFYSPFDAPFYYQGIPYYQQYFHEAIKITDWKEWLSSFNIQQPHLLHHTRTHPPFAILLHYFILKISNNSLPVLACSFVFLSSLSVILIFQIMRELGLSRRNAVQFAFLFSVIPAYNIYSAVSLDGVIATMGAMFLLGLIMIMKRGFSITGLTLFASGIVFANLLTFLALFLVAAAGLVALREVLINKNCRVFLVLFISLIIMLCIQFLLKHFCEYSHVQAFMTAASLEPKSIFNYPLKYFMTRLENITMLAVFLSFGIAAVLFRPSFLNLRVFDLRNDVISMFFAGIIPILLFFLIGGLYTGEGARILLFMYPFFLLPLSNIEEPLLIFLIKAAGTQTIIMQTFGGYFW